MADGSNIAISNICKTVSLLSHCPHSLTCGEHVIGWPSDQTLQFLYNYGKGDGTKVSHFSRMLEIMRIQFEVVKLTYIVCVKFLHREPV